MSERCIHSGQAVVLSTSSAPPLVRESQPDTHLVCMQAALREPPRDKAQAAVTQDLYLVINEAVVALGAQDVLAVLPDLFQRWGPVPEQGAPPLATPPRSVGFQPLLDEIYAKLMSVRADEDTPPLLGLPAQDTLLPRTPALEDLARQLCFELGGAAALPVGTAPSVVNPLQVSVPHASWQGRSLPWAARTLMARPSMYDWM